MLLPDAVNGAEVVETALHQKPDILILDIEMPGLNGLEALKIIRQTNHFIHVIIKTAYSKFDYAQEALNLHADFFLLKPVKKDELKSCIKHAFSILLIKVFTVLIGNKNKTCGKSRRQRKDIN